MLGIPPKNNSNIYKIGLSGADTKVPNSNAAIKKSSPSLNDDGIKKSIDSAKTDAIEETDNSKKPDDAEVAKAEQNSASEESKDTDLKEKTDLKNALKTKILRSDKNKANDAKEFEAKPQEKTEIQKAQDDAKVKAEKADNEWSSKAGAQKLNENDKLQNNTNADKADPSTKINSNKEKSDPSVGNSSNAEKSNSGTKENDSNAVTNKPETQSNTSDTAKQDSSSITAKSEEFSRETNGQKAGLLPKDKNGEVGAGIKAANKDSNQVSVNPEPKSSEPGSKQAGESDSGKTRDPAKNDDVDQGKTNPKKDGDRTDILYDDKNIKDEFAKGREDIKDRSPKGSGGGAGALPTPPGSGTGSGNGSGSGSGGGDNNLIMGSGNVIFGGNNFVNGVGNNINGDRITNNGNGFNGGAGNPGSGELRGNDTPEIQKPEPEAFPQKPGWRDTETQPAKLF
jgi:hypothetical protein